MLFTAFKVIFLLKPSTTGFPIIFRFYEKTLPGIWHLAAGIYPFRATETLQLWVRCRDGRTAEQIALYFISRVWGQSLVGFLLHGSFAVLQFM